MFFFERIIGVGIFMSVLLFICFLLVQSKLTCKKILNFYLLCLCIMAFFYKPYSTTDLYRIYNTIDYYSLYNFKDFYDIYVFGSTTPVARLLYYLMGRSGMKELLPVFSTLICYSIIFHIINKTKQKYNISKQNVACVLFFVMSTSIYISVIGGIRMMLAICMTLLGFFRSKVEDKKSIFNILLYLLAVLTHEMSIAIVGICIFSSIFNSNKRTIQKVLYTIFTLILIVGIAIYFKNRIINIYDKVLEYLLGKKYFDIWEYIMGVLIILFLFLTLYEFNHLNLAKKDINIKLINKAIILFIAIALCFCFEFSFFYRFGGQVAVLFSIPTMMITLEGEENKMSVVVPNLKFRNVAIIIVFLIAFISCSRGSLSSLKFFEF